MGFQVEVGLGSSMPRSALRETLSTLGKYGALPDNHREGLDIQKWRDFDDEVERSCSVNTIERVLWR